MDNSPVRIVQISDTHLYSDPQKDLLGVNTTQSFQKVLSLVKKKKHSMSLSKALSTGDIAQDYKERLKGARLCNG
jgi:Icc protein